MRFECIPCDYSTNRAPDFRKHLLCKSHIHSCDTKNTCHKCLKAYKTKAPYTKHLKICEAELVPRRITQSIDTQTNVEAQVAPVNYGKIDTQNNIAQLTIINLTPKTSLKALMKDISTTWYQKQILKKMESEDANLFDKLHEFHSQLDEQRKLVIREHKLGCRANIDGEDHACGSDLTFSNGYRCEHLKNNFKFGPSGLVNALKKTLMTNFSSIVVTHRMNLDGNVEMLFKQLKDLYSFELLEAFVEANEKKHLYELPPEFDLKKSLEVEYDPFLRKVVTLIQEAAKRRQCPFQKKQR